MEELSEDRELCEVALAICRRVSQALALYEEGREANSLDSLIFDVDRLYRFLLSSVSNNEMLENLGVALSILQEIACTVGTQYCGYPVSAICGLRGRPKFVIKPDQLEYLLNIGLHCPKIAEILGVSLSTIRRRMTEYGFSVTALYSNITDHELDAIVSQIKHEFPNSGYRLMHGHLLSRGLRLHQSRIRDSMHRVDPQGVAIRWASALVRRKYQVFAPLSLWHLDGNHKLIRYVGILCMFARQGCSRWFDCSSVAISVYISSSDTFW